MAQITLTQSRSKNVAGIADNDGYMNRIRALIFEHALNLQDGTPVGDDDTWSKQVLGGDESDLNGIVRSLGWAVAVQANPDSITIADTADDAGFRLHFDAVIDRHIEGWVAEHP